MRNGAATLDYIMEDLRKVMRLVVAVRKRNENRN